MRYKTNIDIMFGERFFATIKNVIIDTTFNGWFKDLMETVFDKRPSLRDKDTFDMWWKVPGCEDAHVTFFKNV